MAVELEELFARQVDVGVATMDVPTDDGVVSTHVVVQQVSATDRKSGQERRLLLVFDPSGVIAMADVLRQAAEKAQAEPS